jgi:hypothetical protein
VRARPGSATIFSDVIAACATQIPIPPIPAAVAVIREGQRLTPPPQSQSGPAAPYASTPGSTTTPETATTPVVAGPPETTPSRLFLRAGDQIRVAGRATLTFSYEGNRYQISRGRVGLECRSLELSPKRHAHRTGVLAVRLESGRVRVRSGGDSRRALVLSRELLAFAAARGTSFIVDRRAARRSTKARTLTGVIVAAKASDQQLRIKSRSSYTAISDARGLRLDVWPFSLSPLQRPTTPSDGLPPYWADGLLCSVGCTATGSIPGWPLKPFHRQHAIRAGINELRPANFHVAIDIEARNSQPVYAIQSGYAAIRYRGTADVNVDVGNFYYWHINPAVSDGQYVIAYQTVIGRVLDSFYHVALSEGSTSNYLNPLRPGGSLRPYTNTEPPIIGVPRIFSDGRVTVGAFAPQSFVQNGMPYETPVLAPSSLAWRLHDARGHALTGLEWAMRGSQNYPPGLRSVIFAPGAANPGFECFSTRRRCVPRWVYWLAGGLTPALPLGGLPRGRYRLTVYAWDWAGQRSALDDWFRLPLARTAQPASGEFGPLTPRFDYDETGSTLGRPLRFP